MDFIKSENLTYDYIKTDENGNVEEIYRAINDIDLNIKEGQFIAILGHNGSGKSTLAKHINALITPTDGTLWIDGMNTKDESKIWDIRQSAGMVFQNPDNQIIGTVVDEDVAFGPENIGIESDEIIKRVEESLLKVEMLKYKNHSPNRLSGGQKQRVAIAGVLAMHPKCIVLDEATAMLDPIGRKEVLETVLALNKKEDVTIIFITHYMNEVVDADKLFVMDKGKIKLQGTPIEVFSKVDELLEIGLSVPIPTLIAHELRKEGFNISDTIIKTEDLVEEICQLD